MSLDDSLSSGYSQDSFEEEEEDDDSFDEEASESAFLPNVLESISPFDVQCSPVKEGKALESGEGAINDTSAAMKEADEEGAAVDSSVDEKVESAARPMPTSAIKTDKASVEEVVDALLTMHPALAPSKEDKEEKKEEWRDASDETGRIYYYNRRTRETRWKLPANAILVPRKKKANQAAATPAKQSAATPAKSTKPSSQLNNEARKDSAPGVIHDNKKRPQSVEGGDTHIGYVNADAENDAQITLVKQSMSRADNGIDTNCHPLSSPLGNIDVNREARSLPFSNRRPATGRKSLTTDSFAVKERRSGHPIFCIYCASSCESPDGLADHLLECEAYMSMLAKHPAAQKELEEMMLRTWGIKRMPPTRQTLNDSIDCRIISNNTAATSSSYRRYAEDCSQSHSLPDAVASPSLADRMTPAANKWTPPPSAIRPVTATSEDYRYSGSKSQNKSLISPGFAADGESTTDATAEEEIDLEDADDDSPLKSECAFCGRSFENLSKHLLRCKRRQRTQEKRKALSANRSSKPRSIQSVLQTSGGRNLPGFPKESRLDGRRLDYH